MRVRDRSREWELPKKEREHMSPHAWRTSHLSDRVSRGDLDPPDGMHVMLSR